MKRIGINYRPLRLALSHRNTVSRLLFLTLFLFSFVGGVTSQTTFTKEITGYGSDDESEKPMHWYLIASPIQEDVSPSVVQNMIASNPDDYDLYSFDQNADDELEWRNYKVDDQEFSLVPGRGYLYASKEDVTLTFTGMPYTGEGVIELTKSDGAHFEGWNLIGNPFAETAYIDREFYVMNEYGSEIVAAESGNTVGPMEGIFVVASDEGETLTFIPGEVGNARSASLALNLSRGSASPGSTRSTIDRVIVRFGEGRMLPKFQLNPNHTKVYIPMDGKDYAVVRSKGVDEMPVNFKADANGSYTLSLSTEEVSFGYLHLIDSKTGKDIDLLESPSYTFEASTTDDASRFKLVYAQDGNTKPNTTADVKRSPTRGMDNVPILPSHGEVENQPAWEAQPTTYDLTVEQFENLELITFVNDEMQMEGDGTIQVEEGAQVMLSITANEGFAIATLMVNGVDHADDIREDFTYTFDMPDEGVTISATAVEVAAPVEQTISLSAGWNWFSTNVEISLDDLKEALVNWDPCSTIIINSQNEGCAIYNGSCWRGSLSSLDVAKMYMIKVEYNREISLTGSPVDPAEHPITISPGYNWIGFPLSESMIPTDAFAGFAVGGDRIMSKTYNATYNRSRWIGQLRSLEPGQGYIYQSAAYQDKVLVFPTTNSARRVSRSRSALIEPHWTFDFHAYQFNQPVVATIQFDGSTITTSDGNWEYLEIAAFVRDECRGSALMRYDWDEFVDEIPVVELPVYYNNSNEEVTFKLYDHTNGIEYDVCPPNNVILTGEEHVELYMGSDDSDEFVSLDFSLNSVELELADDGTNDDLIADNADQQKNVTLQGRTLYKDGAWNTLCLPFNLGDAYADDGHYFDDTPLEGATVMELDIDGDYSGKHTGFDPNEDGGTLYLYFKDATRIEAGKPYIVKWASGDNIENPVFSGVTIDNSAPTDVTLSDGKYIVSAENDGLNTVQFIGSYSPVTLTGGDTSNLYLGTGIDDKGTEDTSDDVTCSKLYYPNTDKTLNACRAYFHVEFDEPRQEARRIVLNYGDGAESTGIVEITDPKPAPAGAGSWYSLDGRRLSGKPTTKGVYINNGRKVVIK